MSDIKYVLDASALLAFLGAEEGGDAISAILPFSMMSALNYSEVIGKIVQKTQSNGRQIDLSVLGIQILPFGESEALETANLIRASKPYGLSIGDRCCFATGYLLATASNSAVQIVTAERKWPEPEILYSKLDFRLTLNKIRGD